MEKAKRGKNKTVVCVMMAIVIVIIALVVLYLLIGPGSKSLYVSLSESKSKIKLLQVDGYPIFKETSSTNGIQSIFELWVAKPAGKFYNPNEIMVLPLASSANPLDILSPLSPSQVSSMVSHVHFSDYTKYPIVTWDTSSMPKDILDKTKSVVVFLIDVTTPSIYTQLLVKNIASTSKQFDSSHPYPLEDGEYCFNTIQTDFGYPCIPFYLPPCPRGKMLGETHVYRWGVLYMDSVLPSLSKVQDIRDQCEAVQPVDLTDVDYCTQNSVSCIKGLARHISQNPGCVLGSGSMYVKFSISAQTRMEQWCSFLKSNPGIREKVMAYTTNHTDGCVHPTAN